MARRVVAVVLALLAAGAAQVEPDAASCEDALEQLEAKNAALQAQLAQTRALLLAALASAGARAPPARAPDARSARTRAPAVGEDAARALLPFGGDTRGSSQEVRAPPSVFLARARGARRPPGASGACFYGRA